MRTDIEEMLRSFLEDQKKADVVGSLRKLFDAYQEHDAKDEIRHAEIKSDLRGISLRVGVLEKEHDKLEGEVERTGSHNLMALKEEATRLRGQQEQVKWAALKVAGSIALLILSTFAAFLAGKGK